MPENVNLEPRPRPSQLPYSPSTPTPPQPEGPIKQNKWQGLSEGEREKESETWG